VDHHLQSAAAHLAVLRSARQNHRPATTLRWSIPISALPRALIWLPYATAPAGEHIRESDSSCRSSAQQSKRFVNRRRLYWAPRTWFDTTLGFDYFSRRGTAQRAEVRARPSKTRPFTMTISA